MRPGRTLFGLAMALVLAACAVSETRRHEQREMMTRRIVDDAMAFNEAYHGAITAQVLLNIMRATNRQPRQYTSMSGFTQSGGSRGASVSVGGIELDRLGESWGEGEFGFDRSRPLAPDFTVSPFESEAFANIVVRPTDPLLFRYYWDSGWNPDLLLMLIVDRVRIVQRDGAYRDLRNNAGTIANDCVSGNDEGGCAFVLAMRDLALELGRSERVAAPAPEAGRCGAFAVYVAPGSATQTARRAATAEVDPTCPVEIVVGGTRYLMALRSLDDIIYYVGHLMRTDPNAPDSPDGARYARLGVTAPGMPLWANERVPLFRIVEANAASERDYAATVTFAGRRYSAGAPNDRFCYVEGDLESCRARGGFGDGSGSVLELLVGILAFNQTGEAVAPPQNSVLEIR